MQAASAPEGGFCRWPASREQPAGHRGKKADGLMQPNRKRWGREFCPPAHSRPRCGLFERLAARTARQPQSQQVRRIGDVAHPPDRAGVAGQLVEVQVAGQAREDVEPSGVGGGCQILHLRYESYSPASREAFSSHNPKPNAYGALPSPCLLHPIAWLAPRTAEAATASNTATPCTIWSSGVGN